MNSLKFKYSKRHRQWSQVVASIAVCVLAALAIHGAGLLSIGTLSSPEEGFVPLIEAGMLAVGGIVLLIRALTQTTEPRIYWPRGDSRRMVVHLAVGLFGYALLLPPLGFTVATFLFLVVAISAWRKYAWWIVALYALSIAITLHLIFSVALSMSLPVGWWANYQLGL
ncbi:MAG: tripartite tricarboxylate transporter TctB family protein [Limnohabitans sp.]|nr:tripartite tricarboxylate transporter TctB family protein [Limnohabitans sp.]